MMLSRRACLLCQVRVRGQRYLYRFLRDVLSEESSVPWYLRPEESSTLKEFNKPMPELPLESPDSLSQVVTLMHNKLGIEDIKIFDKRDVDIEEMGLDMTKSFLILGSGKSDKHLQKATMELMNFIKHDLGNAKLPRVEGFTKSSSILKKERKLRRKLKKNTGYHFEDYGVPLNSWIMVDCDRDIGDMAIHFVTEKRRQELNLELLWCKPEDKHLYKRVRKPLINDDIFSGLRRYHNVSRSPIYKTVQDLMLGQRRMYSTPLDLSQLAQTGDYQTALKIINDSPLIDDQQRFLVMKSFARHLDKLTSSEAILLISDLKFLNEFDKLIPQIPNKPILDLQFYFYKKLYQLSSTKYAFAKLERIFLTKLSIPSIEITIDDIREYIILILESPIRSKSFRKNKLQNILTVIEHNQFLIQGWETELTPYLLCLFSRYHHENFVKPVVLLDDLDNLTKWPTTSSFYYGPEVDYIYELLQSRNFDFLANNESQLCLLMFLTIYGNAKNFTTFYKILNDIYSVSDLQPDKRPWEFVIGYIYKTGSLDDYNYFVNTVYPEISFYNNFSPLFENYLLKMKQEISMDNFIISA